MLLGKDASMHISHPDHRKSAGATISCDHIYKRLDQSLSCQNMHCIIVLGAQLLESYSCTAGSACEGAPLVCWRSSSKCQIGVARYTIGEEPARGCRGIEIHDV